MPTRVTRRSRDPTGIRGPCSRCLLTEICDMRPSSFSLRSFILSIHSVRCISYQSIHAISFSHFIPPCIPRAELYQRGMLFNAKIASGRQTKQKTEQQGHRPQGTPEAVDRIVGNFIASNKSTSYIDLDRAIAHTFAMTRYSFIGFLLNILMVRGLFAPGLNQFPPCAACCPHSVCPNAETNCPDVEAN